MRGQKECGFADGPGYSENSGPFRTPRLTLIPATPDLLRLELNDAAAFGVELQAMLPQDWPPGEYDREAAQYFLEKLTEQGQQAAGWYGWYAVRRNNRSGPCDLVGAGGYLGPPDETGSVEIGYSVSELWRGQGFATELVSGLVKIAVQRGAVAQIIAHTTGTNPASIRVLTKNGFHRAESTVPSMLQFECFPARASAAPDEGSTMGDGANPGHRSQQEDQRP